MPRSRSRPPSIRRARARPDRAHGLCAAAGAGAGPAAARRARRRGRGAARADRRPAGPRPPMPRACRSMAARCISSACARPIRATAAANRARAAARRRARRWRSASPAIPASPASCRRARKGDPGYVCHDSTGVDLGRLLVAAGLALADTSHSYQYLGAQDGARSARRGALALSLRLRTAIDLGERS